jgi:hypothetical protein
MSVTNYERGTSFRVTVTFVSGSTVKDPSDNIALIDMYTPNGTLLFSNSGTRDSTGIYHCYISTQNTDDLGLYRIKWTGYMNIGGKYTHIPQVYQDAVNISIVD